jgi:hypothetical protein
VVTGATTGAAGPGWAPFFHAEKGQGVLPTPRLMHELVERFNAATRIAVTGAAVKLWRNGELLGESGGVWEPGELTEGDSR